MKIQVDAIKGVKIDKVTVWDSGSKGDGKTATADFLSGMMKSVPPLNELFKQAGMELSLGFRCNLSFFLLYLCPDNDIRLLCCLLKLRAGILRLLLCHISFLLCARRLHCLRRGRNS